MLGANESPLREVGGFATNFNRANRSGARLRRDSLAEFAAQAANMVKFIFGGVYNAPLAPLPYPTLYRAHQTSALRAGAPTLYCAKRASKTARRVAERCRR